MWDASTQGVVYYVMERRGVMENTSQVVDGIVYEWMGYTLDDTFLIDILFPPLLEFSYLSVYFIITTPRLNLLNT